VPAPRKYDPEVLRRAVELVKSSGRPVAHIAAELGIGSESLRKAVRAAEAESGQRPDLPTKEELTEIAGCGGRTRSSAARTRSSSWRVRISPRSSTRCGTAERRGDLRRGTGTATQSGSCAGPSACAPAPTTTPGPAARGRAAQPDQLGFLADGQLFLRFGLAAGGAVRTDPVGQGGVAHPQLTGDLPDRAAGERTISTADSRNSRGYLLGRPNGHLLAGAGQPQDGDARVAVDPRVERDPGFECLAQRPQRRGLREVTPDGLRAVGDAASVVAPVVGVEEGVELGEAVDRGMGTRWLRRNRPPSPLTPPFSCAPSVACPSVELAF
jgi:transposase-like protein